MESRVLGDYTLIKQIGQGSLGTVYLAEHRFMKKQYILKLLPEELATDRSFIQRFEEDVAMLSTLDHPVIVKIHNVSFDQGQYFLVTDCIVDEMGESTNLAQYMLARGKKILEEDLYNMIMQLADALDYAHSKKTAGKGIIHRGIKLNNILIGKATGSAPVDLYLSDYGLSRIIGAGAVLTRTYKNVAESLGIGAAVSSSKTGAERYPNPAIDYQKLLPLHTTFLQNYAFMAPEQKRLDSSRNVDAKTDTYAFGIACYYMLMGEYPEGVFELPSSQHPTYEYNWDKLIISCLQSDPNKRPELLVPMLETIREGTRSSPFVVIAEESMGAASNSTAEALIEQTAVSESVMSPKVQIEQRVVGQAGSGGPVTLKPILQVAQLERPDVDPDPASVFNIDTTVKHYVPERKEVRNIQPLLTDMVVIPGGEFYRGSNDGNRDETPRHHVTLDSYAIDIHPVTNEQFVRFLEAMGGEKDSNHHDIIRMRDSRIKRSGGRLSIESGYAKHPVVGVTWYGAIAYAKWVGKRLPTEAEWEIAATGGHENLYPTGEDIEKNQANFFSADTTAVMSYVPNDYGLYDMAGNVYEWCHDWYGYNYYELSVQEPENPQGPLQGVYRVLRGGCWKSLKEDLRCSRRHRNNPGTVNGTYGFRCAADVQ